MNFDSLKNLSKRHAGLIRELSSLDVMERNARKDMASATEKGALDDPKIQRRIGDARLKIDLVESRRGHVTAAIRAGRSELRAAYLALVKEYNALVAARRESARAAIQSALKPFFGNEARELEITLNRTNWPCLYEISRAAWTGNSAEHANAPELSEECRQFIRHAVRFAKRCGLDVEQTGEALE